MHDLMVLGDDISSYVAAAVGIKVGLKTIHITDNSLKSLSRNDIFFIAGTTPITGFGDGEIANYLLKELNIELEDILSPLKLAYQVILPEHRVDFFSSKKDMLNDLVREFPQKKKEIFSFYNETEKTSQFFKNWFNDYPFFQVNNFKQYFNYVGLIINLIKFKSKNNKFRRILFTEPSLRKTFEAQLAFLSPNIDAFQLLSSAYLLSTPQRGIYHSFKIEAGVMEALLDFFKKAGGKYSDNYKLLSIRKTKYIEAEVIDGEGVISRIPAKFLIISNKSNGMNLFYKKRGNINTNRWLKRIKVTHYPLLLHFILKRECLPEKISQYALVINDIDKDIYDDNLIILGISSLNRSQLTSQEKVLLTATVFLPADHESWKRENLLFVANSVVNKLADYFPFFNKGIEFFDPHKSIDFSIKYRSIINPKYKMKKSWFSGFSVQNNRTPLKNVYICGSFLFSDLSCWEGEIVSGMYAVYHLLKERKKQ